MKRILLAAVLAACFALSACGSSNAGNDQAAATSGPAAAPNKTVARACDALMVGDWSTLFGMSMDALSPKGSPLSDVVVVGPSTRFSGNFLSALDNLGMYGKQAANYTRFHGNIGPKNWKPSEITPGWKFADAFQEGKNTFDSAWMTCAADVPGMPESPDRDLENEAVIGAVVTYDANWNH